MVLETTGKPICLFLDANIWRKEQLLNSSMGAALLYRLSKIGGRIALPEVTEQEVMWRAVITGRVAVGNIRNDLAVVRSLVGKTDEIELPSDSAFEEAAEARFRELDDILVRVETSLGHYRSALRRVIRGSAPNTTKEQFRDSLLWEAVVHLLPDYRVVLITNDSDFCESKKFEKGLAKGLIEECEKLNSVVTLHDSLASYLRSAREEVPPLEYEKIAALISEIIVNKDLVEFANSKGFSLGNLKEHSIEAFIIERRGVLALEFTLSYQVFNVKETQAIIDTDIGPQLEELEEPVFHPEAVLVVAGSCFFDERNNTVLELSLADIDCLAPNGQRIIGHGVGFMSGSITIGRKQIPHKVKRPIDQI